jgi:hypothetical protein
MGWPTPQEYNEAIQNPRSAFADAELRAGQPVLTPLGLPRPITGAFASVYQMVCANQRTYAVRCFLREFGDQQERYAAISAHLARVHLPYMANFSYLAQGIRVNGRWYPILKMEWVEGDALQLFVERNLDNPVVLLNLAEQWVQMAKLLRSASIGHGDLQHGNVIVTGSQLRLIDYDGMYVPALNGRQSHEIGHRNYQHPLRSEREFGPGIDHFSTWVVYTSLVALSVQPQLWRAHGGGDECLLFRREDFEQPSRSRIFRSLEAASDVRLRSLGSVFQSLAVLPPDKVPSIDGAFSIAAPAPGAGAGATNGAAAPAASAWTAATADWLHDHVAQPQPATAGAGRPAGGAAAPAKGSLAAATAASGTRKGSVAQPAADATSRLEGTAGEAAEDPSWIRDFIGVQGAAVDFDGDLGEERSFVQRSLAVTVLTWIAVMWFQVPLMVPGAVTAVAALATLVVLAKGYRSNASVQAQQLEWQQLHEVDQKTRDVTRQLKRLQRKQKRAQGAHGRRRERMAQRLQKSQLAEQEALQRHDQKLQAELVSAQRRRDLAVQNGAAVVRKLEAKHATQVASMDKQIGGLRQLEENELEQTLKRRQQQFVAGYMKRQTIDAAIIAGIGPAAKQALRKNGIVRAEDLEPGRLAPIEGIGDAKAKVLLEWRRRAEALALQAAPQNLSKIEETLIRGRYFQRRFSLEQEKAKAQRRLAKEIAAAQESNAAQLKALDQEPAALRNRFARQRDELRKRHQAQRAEWQSKLQVLDNEAAGDSGAIDQEAAAVRQELVLLNAQRASIEMRLRRYEALAFGAYVRRAVGLP